MKERHLLSNLSYSDLKLGHSNGNKSLPKLITDKISISDKKRRCKKTCRFFRRRWSFNLFSMRLRKKTSPYTPSCGSKSLTKYCENWSLWGRFLTPPLFYGPIWTRMSFSNFLSSTRWLFLDFFLKNFKFAIIISKFLIYSMFLNFLNHRLLVKDIFL